MLAKRKCYIAVRMCIIYKVQNFYQTPLALVYEGIYVRTYLRMYIYGLCIQTWLVSHSRTQLREGSNHFENKGTIVTVWLHEIDACCT